MWSNSCKELRDVMKKSKYGYEFELGRGKNYSVKEIADMFNITPSYEKDKPGEAQDTLSVGKEANLILGWNPHRNIVNYIKELNL